MRDLRVFLVLAAFLVAGCFGGGGDDDDGDGGGTETGTQTGGGGGSGGGTGGSGGTGGNGTGGMVTGTCSGTATALFVGSQRLVCDFAALGLEGQGEDHNNALLEVTWAQQDDTVDQVLARFEGTDCNRGGTNTCDYGSGGAAESPVRAEVTSQYDDWVIDDPIVTVTPEGLTASMSFDVYVTLFEDAIPANHTAIPA